MFEAYAKISGDEIHHLKDESEEWTQQYMKVTHLPVSDGKVQSLIKQSCIILDRMYAKLFDDYDGVDYKLLKHCVDEGRADKVTVDIYETYQKGMAAHYFDALEYFAEHSRKNNEEE